MRRIAQCGFAVIMLWAMAGCLSRPASRYYTLDMTPSAQACAAGICRIDRVKTTDAVERPELLLQFSPTEIEYYALDRWVSFPGDLIKRKLQAELAPNGPAADACVVNIDVTAFQQVRLDNHSEAYARIEAAFRPHDAKPDAPPSLERSYEARVPLSEERPAALAVALSRALETIAANMARDAEGLRPAS